MGASHGNSGRSYATAAPIGRADIRPAWLEPTLDVLIEPILPDSDSQDEPNIPLEVRAISLRGLSNIGRDNHIEVKPRAALDFVARTWKRASGASLEYRDTIAAFDVVLAQRFGGDEVTVFIETDDGARRCEVSTRAVKNTLKDK